MSHYSMLKFCRKKIVFLAVVFLFMGIIPCSYSDKNSTNVKIAALVDGHPIFVQEVKNRVNLMVLGNPNTPNTEQYQALEQKALRLMINEFLQLKEAERLEITVEPEEIQQYITHIENQNHWPQGQLKKMLKEAHIPDSTFENHIRANIAWMKLISQLRILANVDEAHVEDTLEHASSRKQPKYLLGEIILYFENEAEAVEQQQLANQIVQELHNGTPFNLIAQQYSMSTSAGRGGDIDWVDEDQLDPAIQQIVKKMPQNSLSNPIKLQDQFCIIALRAKQNVDEDGTEVVYKIRQLDISFSETRTLENQEKEIEHLTSLVKKAKNCTEFSALADSIPRATLQIHENVSTKTMTPEFQKIIENLMENKVSSPTVVDKKGVAFFMLCSKTKEKVSEFKPDDIKEMMMKQKLEAIGDKRLRDIQRRSHIEVRL